MLSSSLQPNTLIVPSLLHYPPSLVSLAFPHTVNILRETGSSSCSKHRDRERLGLDSKPLTRECSVFPTGQLMLPLHYRGHSPYPALRRWNGQTCECLVCVCVCVCVWCDVHDEHDTSHHMLLLNGLTGGLPTAFMPTLLWGLALCRQRENSITA